MCALFRSESCDIPVTNSPYVPLVPGAVYTVPRSMLPGALVPMVRTDNYVRSQLVPGANGTYHGANGTYYYVASQLFDWDTSTGAMAPWYRW
jgi:hypothetical protein